MRAGRIILLLMFFVCVAGAQGAGGGLVRTLDGKTIEGDIAIAGDGSLSVTAEGKPAMRIAMKDVMRASFKGEGGDPVGKVADGSGLPKDWKSADVGKVSAGGSTRFVNGSFVVRGSGADIGGINDSFQWAFLPVEGDCQITARLREMQGSKMARAGVMLRAEESPAAVNGLALTQGGHGVAFQRRVAGGGGTAVVHGDGEVKTPLWLRLARSGNALTAYSSRDGKNWDIISFDSLKLDGRVFVGLAACSGDEKTPAIATFDNVSIATGRAADGQMPRASMGVVLRGGTILAGRPRSVTDTATKLERERFGELSISTTDVARVYYKRTSPEAESRIPAGKTGVLLSTGDFFEGEIKSADDGMMRVNSVIFGPRRFDVRNDVVAAVIHDVAPSTAGVEVYTADGSKLLATGISPATPHADGKQAKADDGIVVVREVAAGDLRIARDDILEIRAGAGRFVALSEVPLLDAAGGGRDLTPAIAIDALPGGIAMDLNGQQIEHGIGMVAGNEARFDLKGEYALFTVRPGVPRGVLPTAAARFVVLADGKELYHGSPRTSFDEAATLSLNVNGAKTLTLKLEPDPAGSAIVGLWADARVVK